MLSFETNNIQVKETKLGLLPVKWDLIKAKDFCNKITDGTHDTPTPQNNGHYLVTSKNLKETGIDFKDCYYISQKDFNLINKRSLVHQYDILFGMIGTVGNATIVKETIIDFAIKNVGLFKLGGDKVKAEWLNNYFSSGVFNNYLNRQQAGTTQQFVGLGFLRKLPIIVPKKHGNEIDWETINRINSILSKVDEAITATKNSIGKAERLKKALMQNLLTGKLKPDGSWRKKNEFYKDKKFGNVPKGWGLKPLGECCKFSPTATYSRSKLLEKGEYKYIHYGDIHTKFNGFLDIQLTELPFVSAEMAAKYSKLINGDLILADASEDYDGVGKGVEIKNIGINSVIAGLHTLHIRDKDDYFVNGYKGYLLHHWKVRNSILRISTGIKVYSISKSALKKVLLPIPTKQEQISIAQNINKIDTIIESKKTKINKLERLKKALMQNLLTGKVRVKVP